MKTGFIYIWKDTKRNKFYIGSHQGSVGDGYIGSNNRLRTAYNSRPETFRRKILEFVIFEHHKELRDREEYWLQMIKPEELTIKYYNEKRLASGGDIISELSEEKRKKHREKSIAARKKAREEWVKNNPELLSELAKQRRAKVKNPSGGSMPGETNPFYGKQHSTETKKKISDSRKTAVANRTKKYELLFPDGSVEIHYGLNSIQEKYCSESNIKYINFLDKDIPIDSNRKQSANNKLRGAKLRSVGYAFI